MTRDELWFVLRDRQRVMGSTEAVFYRGKLPLEDEPALIAKWERILEQEGGSEALRERNREPQIHD